ncbi:hypothetical protein Goshw_003597 [Gossypium schwendimanii]|uniref:Uncharacterized protein n=1 Tax=Gossypium schwendimanii TaxID=34291 RepID=A0A7J9KQ62_GOSSC|nr:hypothetical protein [Gossypium schwendimanii]
MGSAVPHHHSCFSPPPAPPSRLKHVWSETTSKPMRTGNFRFANDSVCHSCSSYLFFNGEEQRKEYGNAGNGGSSKIDTYRRNSFNTRKLPYALIDVNVLKLGAATSYWFFQAPAVGTSGTIFRLVASVAVFVTRYIGMIRDAKEDLQHSTSYFHKPIPRVGCLRKSRFIQVSAMLLLDTMISLKKFVVSNNPPAYFHSASSAFALKFPSSAVMNVDHAGY